jgi:hypothetical protein
MNNEATYRIQIQIRPCCNRWSTRAVTYSSYEAAAAAVPGIAAAKGRRVRVVCGALGPVQTVRYV